VTIFCRCIESVDLELAQETWVPRPDGTNDEGEYELQQRRMLVEQWISASQQFRDVLFPLFLLPQVVNMSVCSHFRPELELKLIFAIRLKPHNT
jgi:hypothetical protein